MISYYCYIITIALSRIVFHIYTVSTKKQRQRIFILFRTDKFDKIWRKYSWVYSGHSCSCIFNEACVILLPEMFYFNDVLAKLKQTVSRMQKAGPFDCCCGYQSVVLPSLCLCQGSRWTFWANFVVFSWFSDSVCLTNSTLYVIAENFWIWGFTVWLFCLSL